MTTTVDIVNRALQMIGTRTTVSAAELQAGSSNEAIQANLLLDNTRDDLTRMAPWACCMTAVNLTLLCALPGTPENPGTYSGVWAPGNPLPPWFYEYVYPSDCLRAVYIVPQITPANGSVPIYPVPTGFSTSFQGPPVKFKVGVDRNFPVGAPVDQRVILTNQQNACLMYCHRVTDPNVMDTLFESAWTELLAAGLAMALTGDKALANLRIQSANRTIEEARVADANEDLPMNDVTPDWIRSRGFAPDAASFGGINWGPLWPAA